MTHGFTVACVQVNAGNSIDENVLQTQELIREARTAGADLILTPENVVMMAGSAAEVHSNAVEEERHPGLSAFRELAIETSAWLLLGSLTIRLNHEERVLNRSFLLNPFGDIVARYDKIHMYDVDVPGGESHRESKNFRPGSKAVVAPTPWGGIGMTVCYDLRFPHLYRMLAQFGAAYLVVPSAFTRVTGVAHWHVLLRARAIETGSYVFAPAQTGDHPGGRKTFGHSMIVDPWGKILAEASEHPEFILSKIEPIKVDQARSAVPAINKDQIFVEPEYLNEKT